MAEHDAVGLLDVELGAGPGDVDDPGDLSDGPVEVTGEPVGTAHEPGPAVVDVGADRRAAVSLDGGDENHRDDRHHSRSRAEFAQSDEGSRLPIVRRGRMDMPRDDSPPRPDRKPQVTR